MPREGAERSIPVALPSQSSPAVKRFPNNSSIDDQKRCRPTESSFASIAETRRNAKDLLFCIYTGIRRKVLSKKLIYRRLTSCVFGDIFASQEVAGSAATHRRDVAMVFGSYAPYPHENVYDNIACGARMRKSPQQEIDARARRRSRLESGICWTGGPSSGIRPGKPTNMATQTIVR
jgi:hypothetical protein